MRLDETISQLTIIDVDRRRWWFDMRLLPPETAPLARSDMLAALRTYVANQFHDVGILDFGSNLDLEDADEDGWRELPPPDDQADWGTSPEDLEDLGSRSRLGAATLPDGGPDAVPGAYDGLAWDGPPHVRGDDEDDA